ncbi:hypothetical protein [Massilia sp. TS11]|uniref:hypothetical protein n=1 Tax=Massilia sp. TS11 TaxID=2908003 RepID=UPI001EDA24C2|nr:hypothetical protein [Massilia sp. TS11]MCG2586516.1 hypothetical protein [Massilia sp. TS11]
MKPWSEALIAGAIARQTFKSRYLMAVPNCIWTGHECDLLVVTDDLRLIDVEVKISRADLKADAKKTKWWETYFFDPSIGRHTRRDPPLPRSHPPKVWKHYYAMPKEIWSKDLESCLPSPTSGVILLDRDSYPRPPGASMNVGVARRATPNRDAQPITAQAAVDIARLASLRMWDALKALEAAREEKETL